MSSKKVVLAATAVAVLGMGALLLMARTAQSHCDTLDGPVVTAARAALEKKDPTPVLKWVSKEHEAEISAAFQKTLVVRTKGPEARELADLYFFETLVRVHRAGEGAPFTGLKPAGTELDPAVAQADKALETGSVDPLVKLIAEEVAAGIRARFAHALEARKHADHNVEAGREFVKAYVEFVHFAERLHIDATTPASHDEAAPPSAEPAAAHKH